MNEQDERKLDAIFDMVKNFPKEFEAAKKDAIEALYHREVHYLAEIDTLEETIDRLKGQLADANAVIDKIVAAARASRD